MKAEPASPELKGSSTGLAEMLSQCALVLARRFSDGATLWCVAPARHDHALHVAVEFVHPAIVGKPALSAVAIAEPGVTKRLRSNVRRGDVVLCIGPGDDPDLLDIARRGPAWGVDTMWIGWGPTPFADGAAMLLWLADGQDSSVVRTYHLLWELSHVCLEQPGVLRREETNEAPSCPTCVDEMTLAEVLVVVGGHAARVRTAEGVTTVDTSLIDSVAVNDLVLTHAGVALQAVNGAERG